MRNRILSGIMALSIVISAFPVNTKAAGNTQVFKGGITK